jgi:hypothetical protein
MLILRFKKTLDGNAMLTVVRPDATSASAHLGTAAGFGPIRDIAHVVVERQLLLTNGLLGMVARGASFADLDRSSTRAVPDVVRAEAVAGTLALELMGGRRLPLGEFNDAVTLKCAELRPGYRAPDLTPTALHGLRSEIISLRRQWDALDVGAALELRFGDESPREASPRGPASLALE